MVGGGDVEVPNAAAAVGEGFVFDQVAQLPDVFAGEGVAAEHDFKAVVFGRVVAAGNHDAAAAAFGQGGEIEHGGGDGAGVGYGDAAVGKPPAEGGGECRAAEAAVAADGDAADALCCSACGNGAADEVGGVFGEGSADDAAYVVGFEDFGGGVCHAEAPLRGNGQI